MGQPELAAEEPGRHGKRHVPRGDHKSCWQVGQCVVEVGQVADIAGQRRPLHVKENQGIQAFGCHRRSNFVETGLELFLGQR